ncbi:MAG TPA: uracil-DNA glycosylase family protein [Caldimonas sp.]|jgi:DNA polymerase
MRWTERQRAMLREMGVRLWLPEDAPTPAARELALPAGRGAVESARAATKNEPAVSSVAAELAPGPPRMPGLAPADWLVVSERLDDGDPQQEQLLENMLRAIGVGLVAPSRERRAVCFTVAAAGGAAGGADADIGPPPLRAAIDAVRPRCVLALGRAAAAALLGATAPLGGLRGRVHEHDGVPVVVTFSLAFLLRHPAEKAKAWADLCLAVGALSA